MNVIFLTWCVDALSEQEISMHALQITVPHLKLKILGA